MPHNAERLVSPEPADPEHSGAVQTGKKEEKLPYDLYIYFDTVENLFWVREKGERTYISYPSIASMFHQKTKNYPWVLSVDGGGTALRERRSAFCPAEAPRTFIGTS